MNHKYLLILLASYHSLSLAASFDCARATGFVETTICQNQNLSAFDDELKTAYKNALVQNKTTASAQKNWLKETRACATVDCLIRAYQQRIQQLQSGSATEITWQRYNNLGIQFDYPSDSIIKQNGNSLTLVNNAMQGSDYIMHIEIGTGDLTQAIINTAIFTETKAGEWKASIGRFDNPPAEKIAAHNWTGLKTIISCGIADKETGFHAAAGTCLWALISDGKHYLLADTQGIIGLDDNTLRTLLSIEFEQ